MHAHMPLCPNRQKTAFVFCAGRVFPPVVQDMEATIAADKQIFVDCRPYLCYSGSTSKKGYFFVQKYIRIAFGRPCPLGGLQ